MTSAELKTIRRRLGLTQKGLAQALTNIMPRRVSVRTVQHWEQGTPRHPIPIWLPLALEKLERELI